MPPKVKIGVGPPPKPGANDPLMPDPFGPGPVPREAIEYFGAKGLKVGFDYTDVWKEEHGAAFTAAKILERDILATLRGSIERAINDGTPFREWKKGIAAVLDKSGWTNYHGGALLHRYRTIYETNTRVARAAGQWQRIERTKELLPYLVYELGPSERHRPWHERWSGVTLPADDPWWQDHFVPNGWNCRCWIRQVSEGYAAKRGNMDDRPAGEGETERWVHPKTGAVEWLPVGVGPGWNYNVGIDRTAGLR